MRFVMYLNDQPVDFIQVAGGPVKVSQLMQELKNKHKGLLKSAATEPVFMLEQIPYAINDFKALNPEDLKIKTT